LLSSALFVVRHPMRRCIPFRLWTPCWLMSAILLSPFCCAAEPSQGTSPADSSKVPLKVIKPDDAKDYDGKEVTVEFKVAASYEPTDKGVCFLNSGKARDDQKQFTVFFSHAALLKFRQDPKTFNPADHFKDKRIRVSGIIKLYQKRYEIEVN